MRPVAVADYDGLAPLQPTHALIEGVDLVVIRWEEGREVSVLYGRCLHRGALLADGHIEGENLICGLHQWDYRYTTGVSQYANNEKLHRFVAWVEGAQVLVDADDVVEWRRAHPQHYDRDAYQGTYQDIKGTHYEKHTRLIHELASFGLERTGAHGPVHAMGVPSIHLPSWDDIQFVTAQLARPPLLDAGKVATELTIGPQAAKPLRLEIPLFVSDMSFGALSAEAKVAMARGAELAGTGIASGEGGMLAEEEEANGRYFYELASARFGFSWDKVARVQAFHFKGGQAAKTGTGGHLPGSKVTPRIAETRGIPVGVPAVSPARFPSWEESADFREFADEVRERTDGIPIGFKLSAQHIEDDLDAALDVGVDYVILDGRGGGTGAAPLVFRNNISVPTIPALARARRHLDRAGGGHVTLIITGGLRTPADFAKAMALGADGVAVSNAAMQAIGCLGMRACHTDNCPVGIATQKEHLRARLPVEEAALRLARFFGAAVDLMKELAAACGHDRLDGFSIEDLTTFDRDMADLTGVEYGGVR